MANPNILKRLTPVAAVDRLEELYAKAASTLADALDTYLGTGVPPSPETRAKFHYPFLRLVYRNEKPNSLAKPSRLCQARTPGRLRDDGDPSGCFPQLPS